MRVLSTGMRGSVNELAFSPDGGRLAAVGHERGVFVFDLVRGWGPARVHVRDGTAGEVRQLGFLPDGRLSFLDDMTRYESGRGYTRPEPLPGAEGRWCVWQAVCGRRVVALTSANPLLVRQPPLWFGGWAATAAGGWEPEWAVEVTTTAPGYMYPFVGGESGDGGRFYILVFTGPDDHRRPLVCCSAATGAVLARAPEPVEASELAAAADGSFVVGLSVTGLVVWRPGEAARPLYRLPPDRALVDLTGAAVHPSGGYVAASADEGLIRLIDLGSGAVIREYDWRVGGLHCVAFSPDGTLGAAGTADGRVVVWDCD